MRHAAALAFLTLTSCMTGPAAAPTAAVPAAPAAAPPREVRRLEGITEYALANGLRVLLFPDSSKDTVTVNVTYLVGSRHEGTGETGMAHLLEHMMFKGSPKVANYDEPLNARGGSGNASASFDRTNYFETLPASEDNLAWALDMEADRMVNAFIRQEDLATEFSVVRNEMEAGENSPNAVLEERILSTAYLWHNYGKSTIGARSDVENVPATSLRRFYEKYYQPDNAVLVVAGKFDTARTLELVQQTFGAIPRPARTLERSYTVEPVQDGERQVILRRVGDVGVVGLAYHTVAGSDADDAAVDAIGDLLTAEPSGRLYKALVQTGLATNVYRSGFPAHDPGVFMVFATVAGGKPLEPVRAKMIEVVEGLGRNEVTEEEVKRFRAKIKKQSKLLFANTAQLALQLSEYAAMGDWRLLLLSRDRGVDVALADVQRVANTYLKSSNRTLGLFIPEKQPDRAPLTTAPDVVAMLEGYAGQPPIAEGEVFDYSIGNIEKRTTRGALASGLRWAFLPKETRGDAVRADLTLRYGVEADFKGRVEAAQFLGDLLGRGSRKHTFQQLKDEFDVLEAAVGFGSAPGAVTVSITTTRANLPAVLDLVDEVLRQPAFPVDQFEIARKEALASLEEARSRPETLAFNHLNRNVQPKDRNAVDYVPTPDERITRIKALKLADVKKLHALVGAGHGQLTVIGDFDPAAIGAKVDALWGGWKSSKPFARIEDAYTATPASVEFIDTPDRENALVGAGFALAMRDDDADYAAMRVVNYVLGGSGFTSRMMKRLREKEGLSYNAASVFQADPQDSLATLFGFAILAPQNAEKGMAGLVEEFERIARDGITREELEAAQSGFVKDYQRNLSDDGFVLDQLQRGLYLGRTFEFDAKLNAQVAALTLEQVNAAARKHVKPELLVRVTGGDAKKARAGAEEPVSTR
jgi:zinc protease